jgi:hypothetical protein
MAELNSQITALLSLGADAMDNLYDVHIRFPGVVYEPMANNTNLTLFNGEMEKIHNAFALRCQGFEPPKFTLKTYEIRYKTIGLKKPAARIDGERVFKLQFRVDAYYSIYRGLLAWRGLVMQPSTGFASNDTFPNVANDVGNFYGTVDVVAIDSPVVSAKGYQAEATGITSGVTTDLESGLGLCWTFDKVWLIDVEDPKFKVGSGESMMVTATFGFGEYADPQIYDSGNGPGTTKSKFAINLEGSE